jgi:hypothetical protein
MSDYASILERARRDFASLARLEFALSQSPQDTALQINLSAQKKLARKSQDKLLRLSEEQHIEVCNYRLVPENSNNFPLAYVSGCFLKYQYLFSQIYDAKKNGPKLRASFGKEAWSESLLEFGYSYSGSLGVVLFVHNEWDFFEGKLDSSINSLFEVLEINNRSSVREIATTLGNAVVKRVHDWSAANIEGGFAADVRWSKSDGRQLGEIIERDKMENIVGIIEATSDEETEEILAVGRLIGGDIGSESFHFVVPNGEDYRGYLAADFDRATEMTLGKTYSARITETRKLHYATEEVERRRELTSLNPLDG